MTTSLKYFALVAYNENDYPFEDVLNNHLGEQYNAIKHGLDTPYRLKTKTGQMVVECDLNELDRDWFLNECELPDALIANEDYYDLECEVQDTFEFGEYEHYHTKAHYLAQKRFALAALDLVGEPCVLTVAETEIQFN